MSYESGMKMKCFFESTIELNAIEWPNIKFQTTENPLFAYLKGAHPINFTGNSIEAINKSFCAFNNDKNKVNLDKLQTKIVDWIKWFKKNESQTK